MTEMLRQAHCVACRADSPRVTEGEIAELKPQIPDWVIVEGDGEPHLERTFKFKDFAQALAFTPGRPAGRGRGPSPGPAHRMGQSHRLVVDAQDPRVAPQRLRHGG